MAYSILNGEMAYVNGKRCSECGLVKNLGDYYAKNRKTCIECVKKISRTLWGIRNSDLQKKRREELRHDYRARLRIFLGNARKSIKERNMPFDITIDFLADLYEKQSGMCALTGRKMTIGLGRQGNPDMNAMSIDKIEAKLGYIMGNVRLVTYQANFAKNRFGDNDFLDFCYAIVSHFEKNEETWGKSVLGPSEHYATSKYKSNKKKNIIDLSQAVEI